MRKCVVLFGLILFISMMGCSGSNYRTQNKPLNAEVRFSFDAYGMTATVTNRNDYNWTNLTIYADDYYKCGFSPDDAYLEPNHQVYVVICSDGSNPPISVFSKVKIETDQGEETYYRQ